MKDENLFWLSYLDIEKEVLKIMDYTYITDKDKSKSLKSYSRVCADLLVRIGVQIETISEKIFDDLLEFMNPDVRVDYEKINKNDAHFDSDFLSAINKAYSTGNKVVHLTTSRVNLSNKHRLITPLSGKELQAKDEYWFHSYEKLKHNFIQCLNLGNIDHVIHACAALYLLNIYNRYGTKNCIETGTLYDLKYIDYSFGSELFALEEPIYPEERHLIDNPEINECSPFVISSSDLDSILYLGKKISGNPLLDYINKQPEMNNQDFLHKLRWNRDVQNVSDYFQILYEYRLDQADQQFDTYELKLKALKRTKEYKRFAKLKTESIYAELGKPFYDDYKREISKTLRDDDIKKFHLESYLDGFNHPYALRINLNKDRLNTHKSKVHSN